MQERLALHAERLLPAEHLHQVRRDAAALERLGRVHGGIHAVEAIESESLGLRLLADAIGDACDDAEDAARADEQPGQIRPVGVALERPARPAARLAAEPV